MANNQTIHQWDFHGYGSQKWIIEHHGNGYYSFRTAYTSTPYYLAWSGDSNSGADHPIVLYNFSSINDVVLWRIFSDPNGLLHFIPKNCEEMMYCLAVETNSIDNGIRLMQHPLYSGKDIEKWTLLKTTSDIEVNIYYDNAFKTLYANGNDNTAKVLLSQSYETLKNVFQSTFGVKLSFNAYPYCSLADTCTGNNPYGICPDNPSLGGTHGTCSHHTEDNCTSWGASYNHFIREHPGSSNSVSVLVSGHIFYDDAGKIRNQSFKSGYGINMQCYHKPKDFPETPWESSERPVGKWNSEYEGFCLGMLHELSHFIGAPDHYCDDSEGKTECLHKDICDGIHNPNPSKRRSGWCVMDNDGSDGNGTWSSVADRFQENPTKIFCTPCYQDIQTYLYQNFQ